MLVSCLEEFLAPENLWWLDKWTNNGPSGYWDFHFVSLCVCFKDKPAPVPTLQDTPVMNVDSHLQLPSIMLCSQCLSSAISELGLQLLATECEKPEHEPTQQFLVGITAPQTKEWQLTQPPLTMQWRQVEEGRDPSERALSGIQRLRGTPVGCFTLIFTLTSGSTLPKWPLLISLNAKTQAVLGERSFPPGSLQHRLMRFWVQGDTETKKPPVFLPQKLSFRIMVRLKRYKTRKKCFEGKQCKTYVRFLNKSLRWSHLSFQPLFLTSSGHHHIYMWWSFGVFAASEWPDWREISLSYKK